MAFDFLEKKRRPAARSLGIAALRHAVGDFGNLENGVSFGLNALEFAGAVQRRDPLAKIVEGQRIPLWVTQYDRRL